VDGSTVPDHGATVTAEAERSHSAVVALQHTHTLAGAQVPQSNATVQRGREELQPVDVWVELDQTAQTHNKNLKVYFNVGKLSPLSVLLCKDVCTQCTQESI